MSGQPANAAKKSPGKKAVETEGRDKRLVRLLKSPLTKVHLLFLSSVLPMSDRLNQLLQSDEPQINILFPRLVL